MTAVSSTAGSTYEGQKVKDMQTFAAARALLLRTFSCSPHHVAKICNNTDYNRDPLQRLGCLCANDTGFPIQRRLGFTMLPFKVQLPC